MNVLGRKGDFWGGFGIIIDQNSLFSHHLCTFADLFKKYGESRTTQCCCRHGRCKGTQISCEPCRERLAPLAHRGGLRLPPAAGSQQLDAVVALDGRECSTGLGFHPDLRSTGNVHWTDAGHEVALPSYDRGMVDSHSTQHCRLPALCCTRTSIHLWASVGRVADAHLSSTGHGHCHLLSASVWRSTSSSPASCLCCRS